MKGMEEINTTISCYNSNADQYFSKTVNVDMSECCDRFLKYVVPGGKIIDIGAGSGRDIKYFKDRGFVAEGIDASEEMCRLATEYTGVEVRCGKIQDWQPLKKYDGIWANASLLHLSIDEIYKFILVAISILASNGVIYISFKKDIYSGYDAEGRFFSSFSIEIFRSMIKNKSITIRECWDTGDRLNRKDTVWCNIVAQRKD